MKKLLSLIAVTLAFSSVMFAQDTKKESNLKNNFKLYGFVRNYFAFDSRESVSGTGDLFYYLPKDAMPGRSSMQLKLSALLRE